MFVAPFRPLGQHDMSEATRLGSAEAARQAALLRVPGQPVPHDASATTQTAPRFQDILRREGWQGQR
ncbi:hypothetical protein HMPREF9946_02300 [Acetobacteraceae bacterium AT-5844]|nr:hypothetical protein HMPREF9946_02300 [Acetobacteraceae bacterium AT-5844]